MKLHRFDEPQSVGWFLSRSHRSRVGDLLAKKYGDEVGLLNAGYQLIAHIDRRGRVTLMAPPFREYPFWQIANKPPPVECPCAGFFDPEVQGEWRQRNIEDHHPLCQFDPDSIEVFDAAARQAKDRQNQGLSAQERPDDWLRLREERRRR